MSYIDTKEHGLIYETLNDVHKPLYNFLAKYQQALDGSRLYDDLIDVYQSQIILYKEALQLSKLPKDVENPMVIDSLWPDTESEPQVVGECAGCLEDIHEGEDIYDCEGEHVHQNSECCMQYVGNKSRCLVAGE